MDRRTVRVRADADIQRAAALPGCRHGLAAGKAYGLPGRLDHSRGQNPAQITGVAGNP